MVTKWIKITEGRNVNKHGSFVTETVSAAFSVQCGGLRWTFMSLVTIRADLWWMLLSLLVTASASHHTIPVYLQALYLWAQASASHHAVPTCSFNFRSAVIAEISFDE